ncbi:hypothetical protein D9Q98_002011 [Chlorella vulgaris]|uniref:Nudix hydrolase domain-containing protein n=1 Tax=Chlorella vulgaris TaxID=3077 RepID=A0A9D4TVL8_CHLVU|nr:hypothetical protein D9Q98_002011 [Chlorella vulgaris]
MGSGHSSASKKAAQQQTGGSSGGGAIASDPVAEKLGAGLLLTCDGEVLLLKRTSNHNHGTWGLPGGNADGTDVSLLETARREAVEEMGPNLPPFEVVAEVPTRRGKRGQKHYTVFVGRVRPEDRAAWVPQLNEEHSAWRWLNVGELAKPGGGGGNQNEAVQLHPVVDLALHTQPYRQTVLAAVGPATQP